MKSRARASSSSCAAETTLAFKSVPVERTPSQDCTKWQKKGGSLRVNSEPKRKAIWGSGGVYRPIRRRSERDGGSGPLYPAGAQGSPCWREFACRRSESGPEERPIYGPDRRRNPRLSFLPSAESKFNHGFLLALSSFLFPLYYFLITRLFIFPREFGAPIWDSFSVRASRREHFASRLFWETPIACAWAIVVKVRGSTPNLLRRLNLEGISDRCLWSPFHMVRFCSRHLASCGKRPVKTTYTFFSSSFERVSIHCFGICSSLSLGQSWFGLDWCREAAARVPPCSFAVFVLSLRSLSFAISGDATTGPAIHRASAVAHLPNHSEARKARAGLVVLGVVSSASSRPS